MNINELRELQIEFEKLRLEVISEFKHINAVRKKFVKDYPLNKITLMTKDDFVIGKGNSSFCNRMENELNGWGNIHGSPAIKFGLYFGKLGEDKDRKYRIGKKSFGVNENNAFSNILNAIKELIENPDNMELLKSNLISPMFKGKILSVYHPDKFLNIFSASHLNYFINYLGLDNTSKSELDKQFVLLNFKNKDLEMKSWSNYKFAKFLYTSFKKPNDEIKENKLSKELKEYKEKDFPPIEKLKIKFVDLVTDHSEGIPNSNKRTPTKIDYSIRSKTNKRIGDRGEQIVFKAEKDFLIINGQKALAKKLDKVSETDDTLGYDLISFDLDGNKKFIEIKTTLKPIGESNIFMTSNEINRASEQTNYFIYIVYEAGTKEPKIWKIEGDTLLSDKHVIKEPILYKLKFKTK
ncbi:MAG: DUF3883 domain-containing protein [Saprospiraceae bacterium]|jgi:hypothetical protein